MIIKIENLSKKYILTFSKNKFIFLKEKETKEFYALKNINFEVNKGECLGIIGANGSGKTTLLKLIGGITKPTSGTVKIDGKILSFLDTSAGFQEELTGRENVFFYGSLMGFKKADLNNKIDDIIAFSNLEKFIDIKLKKYSSGMRVRLMFATAMSYNPDILLIDEIMSVGDEAFQKKSLDKINLLKKSGKTIIFVSHDMNLIKTFCDRLVYLNKGQIKNIGDVNSIIYEYINDISKLDFYDIRLIKKKIQKSKILKNKHKNAWFNIKSNKSLKKSENILLNNDILNQ